ncbi:hypothetical protein BWD09_12625 [Neisseria dentiae]|uniref:Spore coat protein U/FanG domain-containing protein n=1 Tax=Neisseria dentiae TaxID=194197 RepID=A0A1X3D1X3_9NEIS|nr:spore coat U domain-containing protein [Neisseria dentiae]OSI13762.1 hypothetical protein BWD09_12625 [Neisseria dentiae]QMT45442.1 spore coat U domain-containing protein [Neisseria dentiae]STZ51288.1 Uncharacterized secreted protein [Neisseria dentiae]
MHTINLTSRPFSGRPAKPRILLIARLFAAACLLLFVQTARANCMATMQDVNFGNVDLLNPDTLTTQATVTVTCSRTTWQDQTFHVCLGVDGGKAGGATQFNPRYMCPNGACSGTGNRLAFNLYTDANHNTIWGSFKYPAFPTTINMVFDFMWNSPSSQSKTVPVYAKLITSSSNIAAIAAGQYTNGFTLGSTGLAFSDSGRCGQYSGDTRTRFPFTVSATVVKNCNINKPNNIDFGTVNPVDTNLTGNTSLGVTCTSGTPYNIGLKPSNNNTAGAGEMLPVTPGGGNTDRIPYQLRSGSGANGAVWGNTATATQTGNGIGGTGTGSLQNYNIYATVPSADYHYGDYQDTVTVQVNY